MSIPVAENGLRPRPGTAFTVGCRRGLIVLLLAIPTAGADVPTERAPRVLVPSEGIELWTAMLQHVGLRVPEPTEIDLQRIPYQELAVIHLGRHLRYLEQDDPRRRELFSVWRAGGAILIATDGELQLQELDLHISAGPVICSDPSRQHRRYPDCFYLDPAQSDESPAGNNHPWGARHRVACNVSGYMHKSQLWRPLAFLPPGCTVAGRALGPEHTAFALIRDRRQLNGSSRNEIVLALADHSVFINQMLLEPSTQNWELATSLAIALRGQGARRWCRLYHNGVLVEQLNALERLLLSQAPLVPPPQSVHPPLPDLWALQQRLTELGNQAIRSLEDRDTLNRAMLGSPERQDERFAALLKLLLIGMLTTGWWWLWRVLQRHRQERRSFGRANWFVDRRSKVRDEAAADRERWAEAVRQVLQQFFAEVGVVEPVPVRLPEVVVSPQATEEADRWRRELATLWRLAYQDKRSLRPEKWPQWEKVLVELETAHAAGLWRLASEVTGGKKGIV